MRGGKARAAEGERSAEDRVRAEGGRLRDVRAAAGFYVTSLSFWLAFTEGDPPAMAGVNIGHVQLFLERGRPPRERCACAVYFVVGDVDALYARHRENGVEVVSPLADRPYRLRDYAVSDLDRHTLRFGQRLSAHR